MRGREDHLLLELSSLLVPETPQTGQVLSLQGGEVLVSTRRRPVLAALVAGLAVVVGDRVRLEGQTVVAKLSDVSTLPVVDV